MKASPCLGFLPARALGGFLALAICGAALAEPAEDSLKLKNGQRREGKILGVSNGNVRLQITAAGGAGKVESTVPLGDVESVSMAAPAAFEQAKEDFKKGAAKEALAKLKPLVDTFLGLPATWVKTATALLVDAQLESGDQQAGENTLVEFEKAYPDAADLTPLLKAKIAVAKGNFVGAKPLLSPICAQAEQTKLADSSQSVTFGQAFFLMGQVREAEGNHAEALQDYLRAAAIFFEDDATAAKAQERADRLRKEKNVVAP